ncbi:MAG TPA: hypothetical protein V6C78_34690 [Crinalium sp.]
MNQNSFKSLQLNFSGVGFWISLLAIAWLLGAIGLGWIVKSVFILIGLLLITPVIAFFGFRWWLKRNLIESQCPVCRYEFAGINGMDLRCPNCSEPLKVEKGHFHRLTPPGTVDVEAVEVQARQIED